MNLTHKQLMLLRVVVAGNGSDPVTHVFEPVDLDQLIERLDYEPTKQSIQFSIRALIRRGLIERGARVSRRGRRRVTIVPTTLGRQVITLDIDRPVFAGDTPFIPGISDAENPASGANPFGSEGDSFDSEGFLPHSGDF